MFQGWRRGACVATAANQRPAQVDQPEFEGTVPVSQTLCSRASLHVAQTDRACRALLHTSQTVDCTMPGQTPAQGHVLSCFLDPALGYLLLANILLMLSKQMSLYRINTYQR